MIDHIKIQELISADYDQQANPEEKRIIEEHLKGCSDCQKYAEGLSKLSATLNAWPNEDLSPDLEQKIRKSLLGAKAKEGSEMKNKNRFVATVGGGGILVAFLVLVVSMQTYSQRAMQARVRDTSAYLKSQTSQLGTATQYEPYYLSTDYSLANKGKMDMAKALDSSTVRAPLKENFGEKVFFGLESSQGRKGEFAASRSRVAGGFQEALMKMPNEQEQSYEYWGDSDSARYNPQFNTEQYHRIYENEFLEVAQNPLSTLSIDVDTASYSNVRRFLNSNQMPSPDAVRIEEMINYFTYSYPKPTGEDPFSITTKAAICPWDTQHQMILVGLQGKTLDAEKLPPTNLVFLIDVSGSMDEPNKLPLLKSSMKLLVNQLPSDERVAIVVYAGAAGLVLNSTPGSDKPRILQAIDNLQAGGSTAGGAGIQLAYKIAQENFIKEGNNRVVLATDGDFNVGVSNDGDLVRIIEEKRKAGIFLTVLGFGTGNYKDSKMEQLADKGNGNYYYIDTIKEAQKVLVSELGSTLFTIAKDVKIQIEFNPSQVQAYRLIGYENRVLAKEDFNDDTKDAGEMGAGHTVTALYEIVPVESLARQDRIEETFASVDKLAYQKTEVVPSKDLMTVKLRYKDPDGEKSKLIQQTVSAEDVSAQPAGDFQFASTVAEFGLILRDSKFKGNASYDHVLAGARESKGKDTYGYRQEFIDLVGKAQSLDTRIETGTSGINFKGE